jgi:hypothetical protein
MTVTLLIKILPVRGVRGYFHGGGRAQRSAPVGGPEAGLFIPHRCIETGPPFLLNVVLLIS